MVTPADLGILYLLLGAVLCGYKVGYDEARGVETSTYDRAKLLLFGPALVGWQYITGKAR